jgi:hypothetical protein
MASVPKYRLIFHAPISAVETCKKAVFSAGAGSYGHYIECSFTAVGITQFRPSAGANPHIGSVGQLEKVEEAMVETLCVGEDVARRAVRALKQ